MNRRRFGYVALASAAWLSGCTSAGRGGMSVFSGTPPSSSVLEVARASGAAAFMQAVESAGLEEELSGSGPYTLFVPTDSAFRTAGISPGSDKERLRRIVGYHVVPGQVGTSFMRGIEMNHLTSAGEPVSIDGRADTIHINNARILRQDMEASNGVVHMIDRVLTI